MHIKTKYYFYSIFTLFLSCSTQYGILDSIEEQTGTIQIIEQNNRNAIVFLDYQRIDPDKIFDGLIKNIPQGKHIIHLYKEQYRAVPESIIVFVQEDDISIANFELKQTAYGRLSINTAPEGALISLNNYAFGYSPIDLKGIPVGSYVVSFDRGTFTADDITVSVSQSKETNISQNLINSKQVFIEDFSNTSCTGCPAVVEIIHSVIDSFDISIINNIEYHPGSPSPEDIFYKANQKDNDIIYNFYSPPYLPYSFVDGIAITKTSLSTIKTELIRLINQQLTIAPMHSLFIKKGLSDSAIVLIEAIHADIKNTVLKVHLIDDHVSFSEGQGSNGEKEFSHIYRKSYFDPDGIKITLAKGKNTEIPVYFNSGLYVDKKLYAIAYLQNNTKEILQSTIVIWQKGKIYNSLK